MAATLLDLFTETLVDLGEIGAGESISPEDGQYLFGKTNEMLDSNSTERLNIYSIQELQLLIPSSKLTYQIGPGAVDFDQARPIKIDGANILVPIGGSGNASSSPLEIIGETQWRALSDVSGSLANIPSKLYPDYAWPIMNLNLYPVPRAVTATLLQLSTWVPLQQFTALTDELNMPTGYQAFVVQNIKIVIAQAYGHVVDQSMADLALTYKQRIQGLNIQSPNIGLTNGLPIQGQ